MSIWHVFSWNIISSYVIYMKSDMAIVSLIHVHGDTYYACIPWVIGIVDDQHYLFCG